MLWRIGTLVMLFLAACDRRGASATSLTLRGPLVPLVVHAPSSLATCREEVIQYAQPFWRAPYQICGTADDVDETLELDADSVAISLYSTWNVARAARDAEFTRLEAATAKVLGPGRRCGPRKIEWRSADTLHAILQLRPVGSDVGDLEMSPTWKITRVARLGPLDPVTWGCGPVAPAI